MQGKEDCARRASKGVDVSPTLSTSCSTLTVQQVRGAWARRRQLGEQQLTGLLVCAFDSRFSRDVVASAFPVLLLVRHSLQVYRLSEHHHDDWIGGTSTAGGQTVVLLEMLK